MAFFASFLSNGIIAYAEAFFHMLLSSKYSYAWSVRQLRLLQTVLVRDDISVSECCCSKLLSDSYWQGVGWGVIADCG